MTEFLTLGPSTLSQAKIAPTQISEIEKYTARRWSFVRIESHVPLDAVIKLRHPLELEL